MVRLPRHGHPVKWKQFKTSRCALDPDAGALTLGPRLPWAEKPVFLTASTLCSWSKTSGRTGETIRRPTTREDGALYRSRGRACRPPFPRDRCFESLFRRHRLPSASTSARGSALTIPLVVVWLASYSRSFFSFCPSRVSQAFLSQAYT